MITVRVVVKQVYELEVAGNPMSTDDIEGAIEFAYGNWHEGRQVFEAVDEAEVL